METDEGRQPAMAGATSARASRVAVVEDHHATRDLVALALEEAGHEVLAFARAREALVALPSASLDLLVTDVELPDGDGLELAAFLRRARGDLPFLVMSGAASGDEARRARSLGAAGFLLKPFELDVLVGACERLLAVRPERPAPTRAPRAQRTRGDALPARRASAP